MTVPRLMERMSRWKSKACWELFKILPSRESTEGALKWALAHMQCINSHSGQGQSPEVKLPNMTWENIPTGTSQEAARARTSTDQNEQEEDKGRTWKPVGG